MRPRHVTGLAAVEILGALLALGGSVLLGLLARLDDVGSPAALLAGSGAAAVAAFLAATAAIGLLGRRPWARKAQISAALAAFPVVPFGTVFALLLLLYLGTPSTRGLLAGRNPAEPTTRGDAGLAVAATIVGGISMVVVAAAVAGVILVPEALRRSAQAVAERAAVDDLRRIVAAEDAYAKANEGYFDRLECLAKPGDCLARSQAATPFVPRALVEDGARRDYVFTFVPGPPPTENPSPTTSASSMTSYALLARPGRIGSRWFCADGSGRICASRSVSKEPLSSFCPDDWTDLP